jgi:hypothetical protein
MNQELMDMAKQADLQIDKTCWGVELEAFAALVAAAEREACAEICDGFYLSWINIHGRYEFMGEGASECAGAIRARGETK